MRFRVNYESIPHSAVRPSSGTVNLRVDCHITMLKILVWNGHIIYPISHQDELYLPSNSTISKKGKSFLITFNLSLLVVNLKKKVGLHPK